jgi:hypothetical protein
VIPFIPIHSVQEFKQVIGGAETLIHHETFYWETTLINVLIGIYFLVVSLLFCRFLMDIYSFIIKLRKCEQQNYHGAKVVLCDQMSSPYTFLSYIFINKNTFKNLANELMKHELTHVKQRHSYDIILIEFLKILFWFNPIIGSYKRAIQLNHEFLADYSVLKTQVNIKSYQNLLLDYLEQHQTYNLASSLTFSLTKKRFSMMNKGKSKFQFFKKLLIIPIIACTSLACSDNPGVSGKEMLEYWRSTANMEEILRTGTMSKEDFENGVIIPIETKEQHQRLQNIYNKMNRAQKNSVFRLPAPVPIQEQFLNSQTTK